MRIQHILRKFVLFTVLSASLSIFIWSCEEEAPIIKFTERPLLDTTYMLSVPPAQKKQVLIADVTGVNCNNCPKAAEQGANLETNNPGRVVLMALYPNAGLLTTPWPGYDTLTTTDADQLIGVAVSSLPAGIIDNVDYNGSKLIGLGSWPNVLNQQLAKTTPMNIDLVARWLSADKKGRIEVKMTANKEITSNLSFVIAITEDNIIGKQADAREPSGYKTNYVFNHVLRKVIGSPFGDALKTGTMAAGFTTEKHYYINPVAKWKPENLHCVVWVFNNDTKDVLQTVDSKFSF